MEANVILEPGYVLLKTVEEVEDSKIHLTGDEGKKIQLERQQAKLKDGCVVIGSNCKVERLGKRIKFQHEAQVISDVPLKDGKTTTAWFIHESQIMFTFVD